MAVGGGYNPKASSVALGEAFMSMTGGQNINLVAPGYYFPMATVRDTIGIAFSNASTLIMPAGTYLVIVNLELDIVTAGVTNKYGMLYNVIIGTTVQTIPHTYSYVADEADTGDFGDSFTFPVVIPTDGTFLRLNSVRNRGGTGQLLTVNCSVGFLKVA